MSAIDDTTRYEVGLTLLEVLAATMIFAMVMTVLIGTSSTAVHHVGMSARRLEANLVADAVLADLEIQMKQGIAPVVDEAEAQYEQFAIRTVETDLAPTPGGAALASLGGAGGDVTTLLGSALPEVTQFLKQYDIEVSWIEQDGVQSVTRTTFAFDWQNASVELADLFGGEAGGGALGANRNAAEEGGPGSSGSKPDATLEQQRQFYEALQGQGRGTRDGRNARNDWYLRNFGKEADQ